MSIEDISYLKNNSIKQSFTFLIDSKDRDRNMYPSPNNYVVDFVTPFKNIIGMEIIDASIPRTMYNVDVENNTIYYFIGKDEEETLIKDGIYEKNRSYLHLKNANNVGNKISENALNLSDGMYASLSDSINLYNIYNNDSDIGGDLKGITFSLTLKANASYKPNIGDDNSYNILDFRYNHLINNNISLHTPVIIEIIKQSPATLNDTYIFDIKFRIGNELNTLLIQDIDFRVFTHISWTISHDNEWKVYINGITNSSNSHNSTQSIKSVFYTHKYIGKKYNVDQINGDWFSNNALVKDFKIYNKVLIQDEIIQCMNNESIKNLPIWYKMNEKLDNNIIENEGYNKLIDYKDIFNKILIYPGDYTLKTFFSNYDEIQDFEIGFKKHSEPSELTNLMDIYAKLPFILDMKRSTISENVGFDLYNSSNTNNRYAYKKIYDNSIMNKIFHSILNNNQNKEFNSVYVDNYIIISPGIVYFIGNKYIIMRCPEIEEHLYRSLSYSKVSLGLAKFRVDNIGINNEKLSITKLPFREFHPIGKLSRMTLKFETNNGTLYDFKGVNHNIVFAIYYYEPTQKNFPTGSVLNPEYKMNYIEYQYKQEDIEGDDDDDDDEEDFSRDDIETYIKKEKEYNEDGIKLQEYNKFFNINDNFE
jgi:hypothetical protein